MPRKLAIEVRFWRHVDRRRDDECWVWIGGHFPDGYGCFQENGAKRAHRISWSIANGPVPDGASVLHRCDNPGCVNPSHLFLGTHADNMADKVAKGRQARCGPVNPARGSGNPAAKLTERDVAAIRARYAAKTATQTRLAEEYGVSQVMVSKIVRRVFWRHVPTNAEG